MPGACLGRGVGGRAHEPGRRPRPGAAPPAAGCRACQLRSALRQMCRPAPGLTPHSCPDPGRWARPSSGPGVVGAPEALGGTEPQCPPRPGPSRDPQHSAPAPALFFLRGGPRRQASTEAGPGCGGCTPAKRGVSGLPSVGGGHTGLGRERPLLGQVLSQEKWSAAHGRLSGPAGPALSKNHPKRYPGVSRLPAIHLAPSPPAGRAAVTPGSRPGWSVARLGTRGLAGRGASRPAGPTPSPLPRPVAPL